MGQSNSSETRTTTVETASNATVTSRISSSGDNGLQDIPTLKRKKSLQQVKQKLTRSELMALHNTFQHLKTTSPDHGDFIEAERFLVGFLYFLLLASLQCVLTLLVF